MSVRKPFAVLPALLVVFAASWGCGNSGPNRDGVEPRDEKKGDPEKEFHRKIMDGPLSPEEKQELTRIEAAIEQKKDVNAPEGENGMTPLCLAADKGYARVALTLVKHGANVNAPGKNGFTPLHVAAASGRADVAEVLLLAGADPNVCHPKHKVTPLHQAALNGSREIVLKLIGRKGDVNLRDNLGQPPLHYACHQDHVDAATALLTHGARINEADDKGNTALHVAASGYTKVLSQKTEEKDGVKRTSQTVVPLECLGVVKLLLEKGADPNLKNKEGRTPLSLAGRPADIFAQPNPRTAELLKKHGAK